MSSSTKAKIAQKTLVFVYGTLKRGEPNSSIMTDTVTGIQKFIGTGKTINEFPLIIASAYNIPFCLDKPGIGKRVSGELYEVDGQKLKTLDEFERHPTFYQRQLQKIQMDHNGDTVTAWIYMLAEWTPRLLQSSSDYLESYNSSGPHNRPYIESENYRCLDNL